MCPPDTLTPLDSGCYTFTGNGPGYVFRQTRRSTVLSTSPLDVRIRKGWHGTCLSSPFGLGKNSAIAGSAQSSIHGKLKVARQASETSPHWGWGQTVKVLPLRPLMGSLTKLVGG